MDVYVSSTVMQFDTSNKFSKYSCFVAERIEDVSGMEITTSGTTLYSVPYQKELARYKTEGIRKIDFNEIQDLKPGDHILVEFDNLVLYNSSFPENGTVIKKYEHP